MSSDAKATSIKVDSVGDKGAQAPPASSPPLADKTPVNQLRDMLEKMKGQIGAALPKHITPDRMARLAMTAFSSNKDLQLCTMNSILACVMTSAQLGLEIGVGGQAYIIPYKGVATFVPGWRGLLELNNRAARSSVWTGAVFDGDEFFFELGANPTCRHVPCGESDPKKLTHAYAIGRVNGSSYPVIECWNDRRLKAHFAAQNKVGGMHYAHKYWEMYARKIVLLQVLKYMPRSMEMQQAMDYAHAEERGVPMSPVDYVTLEQDQTVE